MSRAIFFNAVPHVSDEIRQRIGRGVQESGLRLKGAAAGILVKESLLPSGS
jgi:hypothetical protein